MAGLLDFILNGTDTAGRSLLGTYADAMNPQMMNQPFGAWQRLGTLMMGAPAGGLADNLLMGARGMRGLSLGADGAGLLNYSANALRPVYQAAHPQQSPLGYDAFSGAFMDPQGRRWY